MTLPVVVAFGPNDSYFIQTPSNLRWRGIPERIVKDIESEKIAHVHHMALGVNGSYFVSFQRKNGTNSFYTSGLPEELTDFLNFKTTEGYTIFNIKGMRLSLGPDNNSYFFLDGRDYTREHNLPNGLQQILSQLKNEKGLYTNPPRIVSLGPSGRYFIVDKKNDFTRWRVHADESANGLSQRLDAAQPENIHDVQLSAHKNEDYFLHLTENGRSISARWTVPEKWADVMAEAGKEIAIPPTPKPSNNAGFDLSTLSDDDEDTSFDMSSLREASKAIDWKSVEAAANWKDGDPPFTSTTTSSSKTDTNPFTEFRNLHDTSPFKPLNLPPLISPSDWTPQTQAGSDMMKMLANMPRVPEAFLNPPRTPSPNFAAAAALARANQQANNDFAMRQMLQARQFNDQMRMQTLNNVQAMGAVTLMQSASMPIW